MKEILKFIAYRILCPVLVLVGVDKLLRRSRHDRLIIFFHGVSRKKHYHLNGRHMDVGQFERLIKYLKKNFDILPVEELCNKNGPRASSRKAIALSFDDGFQNNIDVALPVLEKYHLPATFFICTANLNNPDYIHPSDLIDLMRTKLTTDTIIFNGVEFHLEGSALVRETGGRDFKRVGRDLKSRLANLKFLPAKFRQTLLEYLNTLSLSELNSVIDSVLSMYRREDLTLAVDPECYRLMSGHEIGKLRSNPLISIASHGDYHVSMPMLSEREINDQLHASRDGLDRYAGLPVRSLAFPYGHFNHVVMKAAENNGFKFLFAGGNVDPGEHNVYPRVGVLSMRGYAYNVLSINRAFKRFGF